MSVIDRDIAQQVSPVRPDFVPKEAYLDEEFARREAEKLWPHVWQIACREEELPRPGSFVTVRVGNESFLIVRGQDEKLRAFHNVCQHRGRRLVDATAGRMRHFTCGFHAWKWNLDGSLREIPDRADWGDRLADCEVGLKSLKLDTWGGFVFVNMDLNAQPLAQALGKVHEVLSPYEFERMRFRWYKTARLKVNWKVALEAFNEAYHVQGTHRQLLRIMDDPTSSFAYGEHAMFFQPDPASSRGIGNPALKTNLPPTEDYRAGLYAYVSELSADLKAIFADRHEAATKRLLTEVSKDASPVEMLGAMIGFWREAAIDAGAGWPNMTPEQMAAGGTDWHIFPNTIVLMTPDAAIFYRARPDGLNPEACFFDVWSMQRYAPGKEPALERQFYANWRDFNGWGQILSQDFENMEAVQDGMKSSGFCASRTNPKQEIPVSNFHRVIHQYLSKED